MDTLIDPAWLFRFSVLVLKTNLEIDAARWQLGPTYAIPHFGTLSEKKSFATCKLAWSPSGIFLQFDVDQLDHLRLKRGFRSFDRLTLWVDTRNSPDIHRATRYCYCFCYRGGGVDKLQGQSISIARAKESPGDVASADLPLRCEETERGYQVHVSLKGSKLNGFDPEEFPKLGFFYELIDRELGTQILSASSEMKYAEDPSYWVQLAIES